MLDIDPNLADYTMLSLIVMGGSPQTRRAVTRAIPASDPEGRFIILKDDTPNLEETIDEIIDEEKADMILFDVDPIHDNEAFFELFGAMVDNEDLLVFGAINVIDLPTFWDDFDSDDVQHEQSLISRIETTPMLVLANTHDTPKDARQEAEGFIRTLSPTSAVMPLELFRKLNLSELAYLFGIEEDERVFRPNLLRQVNTADEIDPAGFSSYMWTENAKIDRARLEAALDGLPDGVLTGSGSIHTDHALLAIAIHRKTVSMIEGDPSLVESLVDQITAMGLEFDENDEELAALMHGSTITLVGRDLDHAALDARFAACIAPE